jgi:hypothetical protein
MNRVCSSENETFAETASIISTTIHKRGSEKRPQRPPPLTVAKCCQNRALYGCPKGLNGFLRDIGKISKWQ